MTYDVALLGYDNIEFSVAGQSLLPSGFTFKPDGSKMYMTSQYPLDGMHEYTLTVPWDITTLTYNNVAVDTSKVQSSPTDLQFHPDGTRLFLLGLYKFRGVHEYELSIPWDLSTAALRKPITSLDVSGIMSSPQGFAISPDGTRLFMSCSVPSPGRIYGFTLSTPWDITTAVFDGFNAVLNLFDQIRFGTPTGLKFKPDGTKMYFTTNTPDRVWQYTLSTAWDITTATYDNLALDTRSQDSTATSLEWKPDGSKLFMMGQGKDKIYQYGY